MSQRRSNPSRSCSIQVAHPFDLAVKLCGILVGTLVGMLSYAPDTMVHAQTVSTEDDELLNAQAQRTYPTLLGLAKDRENISHWQTITQHLQTADIQHRIIDWQAVRGASDLADLTVLFLPNIDTISPRQMNALETWVDEGGQLIVSGAVGQNSSSRIRQRLRSLVGAFWAAPLPHPTSLQSISRREQRWIAPAEHSTPIQGGVIIPTGLSSHTVATWQTISSDDLADLIDMDVDMDAADLNEMGTHGSAAVIVTEQTTFFGWQWGNKPESINLDTAWLTAAIARSDAAPTSSVSPNPIPESSRAEWSSSISQASFPESQSPDPRSTASHPAAIPPAETLLSEQLPRLTRLTPQDINSASHSQQRRPSPQRARPPVNRPSKSSIPAAPSLPSPAPPPPSQSGLSDPAEQVAPAGVEIGRGDAPITMLEAIAMREELANIIGRFESALLSANSVNSTVSLQVSDTVEPVLIASAQDIVQLERASNSQEARRSTESATQEVVEYAHQVLDTLPDLIAQREFARAREAWISAREQLWNNFPTDRYLAQPEIRAMWLDRGTIVRAGSRDGLIPIFDRLADAGINTVFFETVNAGYPIYPSQVAPQQNPLTRHWDPLEVAVELAHERGIELHAWVWVFAVGNQRHNPIVNLPVDYIGPIISAHPDWANFDHRGHMIPPGQTKPFLDPANPEVRSYLSRLFNEIVTQYDVDGLQLDYIRYPFQDAGAGRTYGYGIAARQQFQAMTGVDPVTISPRDRQLWHRWTTFRTNQINSFVAETSTQLRQRRPDLILSAAVFAFSEHERVQKIQQNWEVWARRGDVDLIVPMSYALDANRLQRLTRPWFDEDADLGSVLVLPSIRLLNLPESATLDQIQALRDMPAGGYSLFAVENLDESLHAIFSRTQATDTDAHPDPIPYRQPFHTAAARFTALAREWSFALSNHQLWIREPQLEEWRTQTQELVEAFNELAEHPSRRQLRETQRLLISFRSQFADWMYLQSLTNEYRVQTWNNRLDVLDDLLRYGNQHALNR
ncbi:MAG: glycoside hydrolase family 10 protein [Elainellaceae cyanobacterium]